MSEAVPLLDRYTGCLLGGAVGDALGAAVEFESLAEIRARFGPGGIRDFAPAYGRLGAITDDTQMTLFTAEGLIRAHNRCREKGIASVPGMVHRAYLRWLFTQGRSASDPDAPTHDGWLVTLPALHVVAPVTVSVRSANDLAAPFMVSVPVIAVVPVFDIPPPDQTASPFTVRVMACG